MFFFILHYIVNRGRGKSDFCDYKTFENSRIFKCVICFLRTCLEILTMYWAGDGIITLIFLFVGCLQSGKGKLYHDILLL